MSRILRPWKPVSLLRPSESINSRKPDPLTASLFAVIVTVVAFHWGNGMRKGQGKENAVRRKLLVVLLAAMMAVMTIVGASPAFAQQYYDYEPPAGYCYDSFFVMVPC